MILSGFVGVSAAAAVGLFVLSAMARSTTRFVLML